MNILAIGNSFSEDATHYLHELARADGKNVQVVNLYIGGCSLERHYRNMLSNERAYELQYNGHNTGFSTSLSEALLNREWDVVTLQQASHLSFNAESYRPYISPLADFVRKCAPKAKLFFHRTWGYEDGSERLASVGFASAEKMLDAIVKASSELSSEICADGIIRSGELFGLLKKNGIEGLYRDTFHASLGSGRYALALLWLSTLFNESADALSIASLDEPISDRDRQAIAACINSLRNA